MKELLYRPVGIVIDERVIQLARPSSKNAILDAAEAIVVKSGAVHMTLDAVAAEAGISKGGLIYHFPTKEALLQAMIDRQAELFEEIRERIRGKYPDENENGLAIELRVMHGQFWPKRRLSTGLLAAVANDPAFLLINEEYP